MQDTTKDDVVELLLEEKSPTIIVLFNNSRNLREYGNYIANKVRNEIGSFDRSKPFKATSKQVQVGNNKVIFGLRAVSEMLVNGFEGAEVIDGD